MALLWGLSGGTDSAYRHRDLSTYANQPAFIYAVEIDFSDNCLDLGNFGFKLDTGPIKVTGTFYERSRRL